MLIKPSSIGFNFLLGLLAAVPTFGIDMSLPALGATGVALHVSASEIGLTISIFMLGLATTPLISGPISDRYGRKPVALFGVGLFVIGSLGCALAQSLSALLTWRYVQGAGAASAMVAMAIIRDLFEGQVARQKISIVIIAMNVAPMIAPTAGAALLALGGWRLIYATLVVFGLILLSAILLGFAESAKIDPTKRLMPSAIASAYLRVLTHPISLGYILINATAFGAIFAYATGSSLFFINVAGLRPDQYGLIFGASAVAVMVGAFIDGRLSGWGISPRYPLMVGLALLAIAAATLLVMTLAAWMPLPLVIFLMIVATLAFGLITPNATNGVMQPLPQFAGVASAAAGCIQILAGAGSSGLVAILFDGRSALSMTAVMTLCSLLAVISYLLIARPAERLVLRSRTG